MGRDPPCSLLQEGRYAARVSPAYWAITILEVLRSGIVLVESSTGATDVNVYRTCTRTALPGLLSGSHDTFTSTGNPTALLLT